jgi:hypothetical protein
VDFRRRQIDEAQFAQKVERRLALLGIKSAR